MTTSKRIPPLLLAAIPFAVLALSGVGCGTSSPKVATHACARPGVPVTVFVEYDGTTASTRNKTVYLCEDKDWVEWVSCDGEISENIKWKEGSPFAEPPRHDKKVLKSKASKKGTAGHVFDYEAQLVLPGGKTVPIDPRIEIMP